MHLKYRNVNYAFKGLVTDIHSGKIWTRDTESRNGPVMVVDEPVIIIYTHPRERVLLNYYRDANPFFHLYESLWMLAGRNDLKSLEFFVGHMKDYSDDGLTFNGAYGHR